MLIPKLQEIILPGASTQTNHCETFIYEPSNIEEEKLGSLYIVGQFDYGQPDNRSFLSLLASLIKREFYSNPQKKSLDAFEAALKKANSALAEFVENDQINWPGKIHLICAVIQKNTLHLTQIGQAQACLFRNQQIVQIGQNLAQLQKTPYPLKAFGSLVSGGLLADDRVMLATPSICQCFSKINLKRVLSLSQMSGVVKKIQEKTKSMLEPIPLAVLLVEMQQPRAAQEISHQWDKPAILPLSPIDFSEIIQASELRKQAAVIPEMPQNSAEFSYWSRPKVLTKHYFQRLKKIIRR